MSSDSLALNCLVLGNKPPRDFVFVVNIPRNQTISHLQAAIKTDHRPALHVDEDLLDLWEASIVMDDNFDTKMADFEPSYENGCRKLQLVQELSDSFRGDPVREHLHIVVQPPDAGEFGILSPH
jgi:hypothetical protein